ncbi:MFS transporter [Terrarubrum flagellatum]|uniref:MFS transporter n=1 Tax=Terrirubrum flagellatum TaxID=2895980 RepID=UPI003145235F
MQQQEADDESSKRAGGARIIPLVVAAALLMENLDSTVLTTAIPTIAPEFGIDPVHLKLALTAYLMSLAVFVPASGWMADRFGPRRIFVAAIAFFTFSSIMCALSQNLSQLVAARICQGVGGAMMTPVGRLVVVRSVDKRDLVSALAWVTIPALIGPIMGPPLGGFVVTYTSWRWIFLINVPIGIVGIALAWRLLPELATREPRIFDWWGFFLSGGGLSLLVIAAAFFGLGSSDALLAICSALIGATCLWLYARHAASLNNPLLDLSLLRIPTVRASLLGGSLFRIGVGASPFLLPLLLQVGFGLNPLASGLVTFASGAGALLMKFSAKPILGAFGFRNALMWNGAIASVLIAAPMIFSSTTPALLMSGILFVSGFLRSLQFTAVNALAFADVPDDRMSAATTLSAVAQQVAASFGVSLAAIILQASRAISGQAALTVSDFLAAFTILAVVASFSVISFFRLNPDAARQLVAAGPSNQEGKTR